VKVLGRRLGDGLVLAVFPEILVPVRSVSLTAKINQGRMPRSTLGGDSAYFGPAFMMGH